MAIPTISDVAGITAAPELKFTNSGKAVLNMRLAFNDSKYDEQQGKWVNSKTFYVDGTAWEQTAERVAEWLAQGDQVYVTGRLETQQWEQDGQKCSKPILNVQAIRKLAPAAKPQGQQQSNQGQQQQPWGGQQQSQPPANQWGNGPSGDNEPPF